MDEITAGWRERPRIRCVAYSANGSRLWESDYFPEGSRTEVAVPDLPAGATFTWEIEVRPEDVLPAVRSALSAR